MDNDRHNCYNSVFLFATELPLRVFQLNDVINTYTTISTWTCAATTQSVKPAGDYVSVKIGIFC